MPGKCGFQTQRRHVCIRLRDISQARSARFVHNRLFLTQGTQCGRRRIDKLAHIAQRGKGLDGILRSRRQPDVVDPQQAEGLIIHSGPEAVSADAIQQNDLPKINASKRVLGVIRPTTEIIGQFSKTGNVGILATNGTVISGSYPIEIQKFYPGLNVFQQACPMWVPLVENNEYDSPGADYFIQKNIDELLDQSSRIDTILLACTHYPLLMEKIKRFVPANVTILSQGKIVADGLADYLDRHPEIEGNCSKQGQIVFFTTDSAQDFDNHAAVFYGKPVKSSHLSL